MYITNRFSQPVYFDSEHKIVLISSSILIMVSCRKWINDYRNKETIFVFIAHRPVAEYTNLAFYLKSAFELVLCRDGKEWFQIEKVNC